tara:strand:- start:1050 stop:2378 length:1329 start_codon:yes stop_codon:yes gene_type:complete
MIQALQLLLSLSILVVLHEFGHYITARMFGCRVEKFYLFMDWKFALWKKKIGETEFGLGWLPLGGYVKISGFIDESMDSDGLESDPEPWELRAKPAWQRLIVMLGGIIVNILLAWLIYSMVLFSWGEEYIPVEKLTHGLSFNEGGKKLGFQDGDLLVSIDGVRLVEFDNMMLMSSILFEGAKSVLVNRGGEDVLISIDNLLINDIISNLGPSSGPLLSPNFEWIIGEFVKGSVAERAGLKRGDQILAINDLETPFFNSVARDYLRSQAGQTITVVVQRGFGGRVENVPVELGEDGFLGLSPLMDKYFDSREYSFLSSFSGGLNKTINMVNMYWGQMKTIFNPKTGGYKHVGGVISIGKMFPGEWNWLVFWSMTALLSIILAIMNLLPIPALDGGHALIAITEILTGKKLPLRVLMPLQVAGMIVLFALLIYANGMDIVRLFN